MPRIPLTVCLVALALPASGVAESFATVPWDPVVRGPYADTGTGPARSLARVRHVAPDAAAPAVVVVRGGAPGPADPEDGSASPDLALALARVLGGLCRLDPRYRDASARALMTPTVAEF